MGIKIEKVRKKVKEKENAIVVEDMDNKDIIV